MSTHATSKSPDPEGGARAAAIPPVTRPAVEITAVTGSDDFLLELGELLGGQAAVHPVDSVVNALPLLAGTKTGQLLVLDSREIPDMRAAIELARDKAPHALVLVFAGADADRNLPAAARNPNVFALLPLPVDTRKTAAVLEAALAESLNRRPAAAAGRPAPALTVEAFEPQAEPRGTRAEPAPARAAPAATAANPFGREPRVRRGPLLLALGAVLALTLLAAGGWWLFGGSKAPQAPPPRTSAPAATPAATAEAPLPEAPVETQVLHGKVDDLLEKARLAMRERHYTDPSGENALLFYRSVVAEDPQNGEAREGLQRIGGVLVARCTEALDGGRLEEAALALANLKLAVPKDARTPPLEAKLVAAQFSRALGDGNLERAAALLRQAQAAGIAADQVSRWRGELARHQEDNRLQRLAGLAADRIREGRLIDGGNDSAQGYVAQLRELAPGNSLTQRAQRELNAAYLRRARDATLAHSPGEAEHWIEEARSGGVSAAEISAFQRDLSGARQKQAAADADRLVSQARERLQDGHLTDPPQDSAAYYLAQAQAADANNPSIAALTHDLAARLMDRARKSIAAGNGVQAEADLVQARQLGADARDIQSVQQAAGAAHAATQAPGAVDASTATLKRLRYVAPEYPSRALSLGKSGQVTVGFTIDASGATRDIHVISSDPPRLFDDAATEAVRRWRYQPVTVNGQPTSVPVRMIVRFELPHG